jgi:hypothetical protein
MPDETGTTVARLPVEAYEKLVALLVRLNVQPMKSSLFGAAVDFAMAHEAEFVAYLSSVEPVEDKEKTHAD